MSKRINWKKSVALKKGRRYFFDLIRRFPPNSPKSHTDLPSIIVNSVPKSGTHLLMQVVDWIPKYKDTGNFIASTPSFTMKEQPPEKISSKIGRLMPGEIVGAHAFYSEEAEATIASKNALHLFIYRDPRDVCISEAHYLSDMNKWHKLHSTFAKQASVEDCINLSIHGMPDSNSLYFPSIIERYERFFPWIESDNTISIRFEDLVSSKRESVIKHIFARLKSISNQEIDIDAYTQKALENISAEKSHTYRMGQSGQWRSSLSNSQLQFFDTTGKSLLSRLGYPLSSETKGP